jgi:carbamoyl-phosphate synthase small subunit
MMKTESRMETKGILLLEDGTAFHGKSFGASGEALGEIVFNTSLTGYQEILTDPSYTEQIVTMTCPEIGNTGVNQEDVESGKPFLRGFLVREYNPVPSNWRAVSSLGEYLEENGIVSLDGIDTRRLVLKIRSHGAMRGIISTVDFDEQTLLGKVLDYPGLVGRDLVRDVTVQTPYLWEEGLPKCFGFPSEINQETDHIEVKRDGRQFHVVAYDYGIKRNILRLLVGHGCRVTVVPATFSASETMDLEPDGVFLSNGPGDPFGVEGVRAHVLELMEIGIPIFGICLGHQILALAAGAKTFKLKFGHRGANQPVKDLRTGKVEITSQNHGFAVEERSVEETGFSVSHINLNDRTVEGLIHEELPVFSVQYHPEASPGPHDASYLFSRFIDLMDGRNASAE